MPGLCLQGVELVRFGSLDRARVGHLEGYLRKCCNGGQIFSPCMETKYVEIVAFKANFAGKGNCLTDWNKNTQNSCNFAPKTAFLT